MIKLKGRAVAAILWCKNPEKQAEEILMTRRLNLMRTFPGYFAFPGGKIDAGESEREALKRELQEEVGLDFDVSQAIDHGSVTTPETHPYRFETRYFSIEVTLEQKNWLSKNFDQLTNHPEFSSFEWDSASNFLQKYQSGSRLMVPPVRFFLQEIALKGMTKALMQELNHEQLKSLYFPLEVQAGLIQLFIPSNTLPPHFDTNCFIFGAQSSNLGLEPQEVFLVDPSPKDLAEWEKMIQVFAKLNLFPSKIICTHHHIDHCSFLDLTANHFNVDVYAHPMTWELGVKVDVNHRKNLLEGDVVGKWLGLEIKVVHVPGHDAGQIALTTDQGDFFIAGDLFQSEGSVVIGGVGSSMQQYMQTLKKLVEFNPKVLYPSHGIPVGGVEPIKKLIRHRLKRHQDICTLYQGGKKIDEITHHLYAETPANLIKYARANIESHMNWMLNQSLEEITAEFKNFL